MTITTDLTEAPNNETGAVPTMADTGLDGPHVEGDALQQGGEIAADPGTMTQETTLDDGGIGGATPTGVPGLDGVPNGGTPTGGLESGQQSAMPSAPDSGDTNDAPDLSGVDGSMAAAGKHNSNVNNYFNASGNDWSTDSDGSVVVSEDGNTYTYSKGIVDKIAEGGPIGNGHYYSVPNGDGTNAVFFFTDDELRQSGGDKVEGESSNLDKLWDHLRTTNPDYLENTAEQFDGTTPANPVAPSSGSTGEEELSKGEGTENGTGGATPDAKMGGVTMELPNGHIVYLDQGEFGPLNLDGGVNPEERADDWQADGETTSATDSTNPEVVQGGEDAFVFDFVAGTDGHSNPIDDERVEMTWEEAQEAFDQIMNGSDPLIEVFEPDETTGNSAADVEEFVLGLQEGIALPDVEDAHNPDIRPSEAEIDALQDPLVNPVSELVDIV